MPAPSFIKPAAKGILPLSPWPPLPEPETRRESKMRGKRIRAAPHTACRQLMTRRFHIRNTSLRLLSARASISFAHMHACTCRNRA